MEWQSAGRRNRISTVAPTGTCSELGRDPPELSAGLGPRSESLKTGRGSINIGSHQEILVLILRKKHVCQAKNGRRLTGGEVGHSKCVNIIPLQAHGSRARHAGRERQISPGVDSHRVGRQRSYRRLARASIKASYLARGKRIRKNGNLTHRTREIATGIVRSPSKEQITSHILRRAARGLGNQRAVNVKRGFRSYGVKYPGPKMPIAIRQ